MYAERKQKSPGFCSWSRCFSVIFALFFFVYIVGAGTKDAIKNKKKALRKGPPITNNLASNTAEAPLNYPTQSQEDNDDDQARDEEERLIDKKLGDDIVEEEPIVTAKATGHDSQDVETSISTAISEIQETEAESVLAGESMFIDAYRHIEDNIRIGLGRIFGNADDLTDEEIDEIAKEVSKNLEEQVKTEFRNTSDSLADIKADEIRYIVEKDLRDDISTKSIRGDVKTVELHALKDLKVQINKAAQEAQDGMTKKAAKIEKESIDKFMVKKAGKKHKVKIVNDKVEKDDSPDSEDGKKKGAPNNKSDENGKKKEVDSEDSVTDDKKDNNKESNDDEDENKVAITKGGKNVPPGTTGDQDTATSSGKVEEEDKQDESEGSTAVVPSNDKGEVVSKDSEGDKTTEVTNDVRIESSKTISKVSSLKVVEKVDSGGAGTQTEKKDSNPKEDLRNDKASSAGETDKVSNDESDSSADRVTDDDEGEEEE